jgi:hypothetical protein
LRGCVHWRIGVGWVVTGHEVDFPVRGSPTVKIARANFAFQIASKFYILILTLLNIENILSFINIISKFGLKLVLKWVLRA